MPTKQFPSVRGRRARVTRLDNCGAPLVGPRSVGVTDGFVTIDYAAVYAEAEEIEQRNASGGIAFADQPKPQLKWYTAAIAFTGVDPSVLNLVTGQEIVTDADANEVGLRISSDLVTANFALEVWTDIPGQLCQDGDEQFGYFLLPFVVNGVLGDFQIANAALNLTVSGRTQEGSQWGVGPYDIVQDDEGVAGPLLQPFGPRDHLHLQVVDVVPPEAYVGTQPLAA